MSQGPPTMARDLEEVEGMRDHVKREAGRLNLLRILREIERQRPGSDGDKVRFAIRRLEAMSR
jgi:hypothetical protein